MGFDLGALIANLLLAYCAVPGNGQGEDYAEWLLEQVSQTGNNFGGMTFRESRATGTEGKPGYHALSTALLGAFLSCEERHGVVSHALASVYRDAALLILGQELWRPCEDP